MRRATLAILLVATAAQAQPEASLTPTVTLRNHRFEPAIITVPAGQKIELRIVNQDDAEEEFDSDDLRREKIVRPHAEATVYFGPLRPGSYSFQGEFNPTTAQGHIEAR